MARNKHLWLRLQRLEEEYNALARVAYPETEQDALFHRYLPYPSEGPQDMGPGRLTLLQKEITALRTRFGIGEALSEPEAPPLPRVITYPLPPGKIHPVSPMQVQEALAELPACDLVDLNRVLLTDSRRDRHASYGGAQIKLCYPVDRHYRVRLRRYEGWLEVLRFGAWIEREDDVRYVCWEPNDLRDYVLKHLLLHEIGHHVALLRGFGYAVAATRREEEFAESYAHALFDPER